MSRAFGLAGFDSSAALVQAAAHALKGEEFPAAGHSPYLQHIVRFADFLPQELRRGVFAAGTGIEGVSPEDIEKIDADTIAQWATDLYPKKKYPAAIIGSAGGNVVHLAAALGVPWLPQTWLIALRRQGGGVDDPRGDLDHARQHGESLVNANPGIQLADLYRAWYRRLGRPEDRLLVESFILLEPHWALRTASVPFWTTFNAGPSPGHVQRYLDSGVPFDVIRMMIFPHGTESVGLPSIDDWRAILRQARGQGSFLGVNEDAYPHHFSGLARYHIDMREVPADHELPAPMPFSEFEQFLEDVGAKQRYPVRLAA